MNPSILLLSSSSLLTFFLWTAFMAHGHDDDGDDQQPCRSLEIKK